MKSINCDWRILFDFCMAEARAQSAVSEQRSLMARRERGANGGGISKTAHGAVVKARREQLTEAERGQAQQAAAEQSARDEADRKAAAAKQRAASPERVR